MPYPARRQAEATTTPRDSMWRMWRDFPQSVVCGWLMHHEGLDWGAKVLLGYVLQRGGECCGDRKHLSNMMHEPVSKIVRWRNQLVRAELGDVFSPCPDGDRCQWYQ